jgi:lysophospholipase L1-like esterase
LRELILAACHLIGDCHVASLKPIRYAVIGDSYSIGEGATEAESWPALLARHLSGSGLTTELVSNPSRTGWTTADAIEHELPLFRAAGRILARSWSGVNDWVQGVAPQLFRQRLAHLMDECGGLA